MQTHPEAVGGAARFGSILGNRATISALEKFDKEIRKAGYDPGLSAPRAKLYQWGVAKKEMVPAATGADIAKSKARNAKARKQLRERHRGERYTRMLDVDVAPEELDARDRLVEEARRKVRLLRGERKIVHGYPSYGRGGLPASERERRQLMKIEKGAAGAAHAIGQPSWTFFNPETGEWEAPKKQARKGKKVKGEYGRQLKARKRGPWYERMPVSEEAARVLRNRGAAVAKIGRTRYGPGRGAKLHRPYHEIAMEVARNAFPLAEAAAAKAGLPAPEPVLHGRLYGKGTAYLLPVMAPKGRQDLIGTVRVFAMENGEVVIKYLTETESGRPVRELLKPFMQRPGYENAHKLFVPKRTSEGRINPNDMTPAQAIAAIDRLIAMGKPSHVMTGQVLSYNPASRPRVAGHRTVIGEDVSMERSGFTMFKELGEMAVKAVQDAIINKEYGWTLSPNTIRYRRKLLEHGMMHREGKQWYHDFPSRRKGDKIPVNRPSGTTRHMNPDPSHPLLWTGTLVNNLQSHVIYPNREVLYGIFRSNQATHPVDGKLMFDIARFLLKKYNFLVHPVVRQKVRGKAIQIMVKYMNKVIRGARDIQVKRAGEPAEEVPATKPEDVKEEAGADEWREFGESYSSEE